MKVLVTGGSGFVGSHMIDALTNRGYKTINLDLKPPKACSGVQFKRGDIRDDRTIRTLLKIKPEIIVHMAAKARFGFGLYDPVGTYTTNVIGTLKLLEASRSISVLQKFIYISSEQAYGNAQYLPIDEKHPLCPYNVYGSSKAAADMLAQIYSQWVPVVVLRTGMGYGPRSPPSQVVTKFFLKGMSGEPIPFDPRVKEKPSLSPTRDCNYISNIIDGFILALEKELRSGSIFNIGSGFEISILELGKKIAKLTNGKIIFSDEYQERPGELGRRLLLDITKARRELGYRPKISLEEGLKLTYEWLKENLESFDKH